MYELRLWEDAELSAVSDLGAACVGGVLTYAPVLLLSDRPVAGLFLLVQTYIQMEWLLPLKQTRYYLYIMLMTLQQKRPNNPLSISTCQPIGH